MQIANHPEGETVVCEAVDRLHLPTPAVVQRAQNTGCTITAAQTAGNLDRYSQIVLGG